MSQIPNSGLFDQIRLSGLDVNDQMWQATTGAAIQREQERAAHAWSVDGFWKTTGKAAGEFFSAGMYDAGPRSGVSAFGNFLSDNPVVSLSDLDPFRKNDPIGEVSGTDAAGRLQVNGEQLGLSMTANLRRAARYADRSEPGYTVNEQKLALYGTDDQGNLFDEKTLAGMAGAQSDFELATRRAIALREREVAIRKQSMSPAMNFAVGVVGGFGDPAMLASGMVASKIGGAVSSIAFKTTIGEAGSQIVLPGTASVFKNLAARGLISGAENVGQSVILNKIAGQDYSWNDAMRDMAFGSAMSTIFGGLKDSIEQSSEIINAQRFMKDSAEAASMKEKGVDITDKGATFYQHVPGFTRTALPSDMAASEMVSISAMDHAESAGGSKSTFAWLVGKKVQMDGIGEVEVTGIDLSRRPDGRIVQEVRGTIDGREVKMEAAGVSIDRSFLMQPGGRVRLDDGTLGTIESATSESTPFAEANRPPKKGDATTTVTVRKDDGSIVKLNPNELLARSGSAVVRRGQVVFDPANSSRAVIAFLKSTDASTLAHEPGHVFRRTLRDIDSVLADKMNEHYGQNGDGWTVDAEERFARDFEQYVKEGKAPTPELQTTFQRFAAWLADLWESIGGNKAELTDIQRQAFGSLLDSNKARAINGELGSNYANVRAQLRRAIGENNGSKAVESLMLANAKAWSRATGRNIDEYFSNVIAGFTNSMRNPFTAPIKRLPPRTIVIPLEPPTSKGELGTTPKAPAPESPNISDRAQQMIDSGEAATMDEAMAMAKMEAKNTPPSQAEPAKPDANSALIGRDTKIVLGNGRVMAAQYAIVDADSLIPSNDARKGFAKNPAGDLNERPYHDPTEGKASREKVYAIADNPDPSQIINDAPTSNIGPPIVGPNGVVYGGNARSMGMQLAYSRGGPASSAIRAATLAAADRFGIERSVADNVKNPVLVRMVTAADAGKPGELSRALNEDVATGRTADADAVSRGRQIKPDTAASISNAIGDRTIDESLRDPKTAMQIVKAMRQDGAMSEKDVAMFVQGDTLNNEGKLTIKRTLLGVVIPDVRTLAETPPSIENVFIRALGPLTRLLADTRGKASDFRATIDGALQALSDYRRGGFEHFDQMLTEPAGFIPEPWRENQSAIALARIIESKKPTEVYHLLNQMASDIADAKSGQVMLGMSEPPTVESVIAQHLGIDALAQDGSPNELAQDVLDLTDTIKSEDQNGQLPSSMSKGTGVTGGRGVRIGKAPRTDRAGILKAMDHPLLNIVTNAIFQDPALDSQGLRSNASAEQFASLKIHTAVDGYLRKMHDHLSAAASAAGIGKINIPARMRFETKFREEVGRLVRDPNATAQSITDPHLRDAVETTREAFRQIGQIGKDNKVKNFDKFALDDNYLTRKWQFDKLHAMQQKYGQSAVLDLFEQSVLDARPNLTRPEARVLGEILHRKLFNYGKEAGIERNAFAAGLSNREYLLRVMKEANIDEVTATSIADKVAIDKQNTGTLSVAKRRTLLNEKTSIKTATGETIGIEDLLDNDVMSILHNYGQQVISESAMTQVRRQIGAKLGMEFTTDAGLIEHVTNDMRNAGYSVGEINKAAYQLDTGIKRLRGVALDDSGFWSDNAWRIRQFAATVGNGSFGIPAMFELGHAITRLGVRSTLANMPAVLQAWKAMRRGEINDPALKAMLYTIGVGHDSVSARYFGSWEHGHDPFQTNNEGRLAKLDRGLAAAAKVSRFISGVPQITEISRMIAANGVQGKIVQQAFSGKQPSARRLAWLGMDQARWDAVSNMVKQNHRKGPGGLVDVNLDGWTDMQAKHDYIEAVRSSVNTIIQEGGIGASHPWLETEVGKLIFQFRQFGIMAYPRQTLAQYQIGDFDAIGRGMVAAVPFGMMQYMAGTYLNSLGRNDRDEYLNKMLTPGRMTVAAFSRASFTSIGPVAYDTLAATFGAETLGGFRASGLESDPLLGNPTFSIIMSGRRGIGGGVRSLFDPGYKLSDQDIRGIRTVVPFSRLPGTSMLWNEILNRTPSHSIQKTEQP